MGAVPVEGRIHNPQLLVADLSLGEHLEGSYEGWRLYPSDTNRKAPSARKPRDDGLTLAVGELVDPDAACWSHILLQRGMLFSSA